ncbi:hypothetical protein BC629DRAFT_1550136 [Irpex lacteus]|nr:hypothetical protein BC629DRAFT_1550136 [Irpex lacteus]
MNSTSNTAEPNSTSLGDQPSVSPGQPPPQPIHTRVTIASQRRLGYYQGKKEHQLSWEHTPGNFILDGLTLTCILRGGIELQKDKAVKKRTEVTSLVSRGRFICAVERGTRGGITLIGTCRLGIRDGSQSASRTVGLQASSFSSATLRVIHRPRVSHTDLCSSVL